MIDWERRFAAALKKERSDGNHSRFEEQSSKPINPYHLPETKMGKTRMERISWEQLTQEDARGGGFDNRFELAYALKRAGYRFKPLGEYTLYRCHFAWLDSTNSKREI